MSCKMYGTLARQPSSAGYRFPVQETYRIPILCPLPQTVIEIIPIAQAVVHIANSVVLLELVHGRCKQSG